MIKIINTVMNKEVIFNDNTFKISERELSVISANHTSFKGLYQHGESYINTILESRVIPLTGFIDSNVNHMESHKKELIRIFNPLNKLKIIKDNKYEIECYSNATVKFSSTYSENNGGLCKFTVDLYCPNPFWKDSTESKAEIALWKGQFHFPLTIPKEKGIIMGLKQPSLIVNILNNGDVKTGIIIEFKARGSLTNPSLFNVNTREYIKINKGMVAGEVIRVNTNFNKKRIESISNGVTTNILNYIDLGGGDTFLQLDVGDNLLRYDADTNPSNLEINIYFSPKYLGV